MTTPRVPTTFTRKVAGGVKTTTTGSSLPTNDRSNNYNN